MLQILSSSFEIHNKLNINVRSWYHQEPTGRVKETYILFLLSCQPLQGFDPSGCEKNSDLFGLFCGTFHRLFNLCSSNVRKL